MSKYLSPKKNRIEWRRLNSEQKIDLPNYKLSILLLFLLIIIVFNIALNKFIPLYDQIECDLEVSNTSLTSDAYICGSTNSDYYSKEGHQYNILIRENNQNELIKSTAYLEYISNEDIRLVLENGTSEFGPEISLKVEVSKENIIFWFTNINAN